jgi:hypothetical protein
MNSQARTQVLSSGLKVGGTLLQDPKLKGV